MAAAGVAAEVLAIGVRFPDLDAAALAAWRSGMAQHAPSVASLAVDERDSLAADAVAGPGGRWPPLERSIILVRGRRR